MKIDLLPSGMNRYKANLHCHSTVSDGVFSPEELKKMYMDAGYSILAYSDHNVLVDHSELTDGNFLAMTATELDTNLHLTDSVQFNPCYHINFLAKDPHNDVMPRFNPTYHAGLGKKTEHLERQKYLGTPDYERNYSRIGEMIADFNRHGFLATLNHVTWSIQDAADYQNLDGLFAMEVFNNSSYVEGFDEINGHEYDAILRRGKRIFCVAADDNHDAARDPASPYWDSFGGWIVVCAKELTYPAVIDALEKGLFYSSMGPEIKSLFVEDGILHVETSPAARITMSCYGRHAIPAIRTDREHPLTHAEFPLRETDRFFRVTVSDGEEHFAWSNAYFTDTTLGKTFFDGKPFRP